MAMDSNYLMIEEFVGEEDLEYATQQALAVMHTEEVYDIYPSISNVPGWGKMIGKRGVDTQPRWTIERFLAV